MPMPIRIARLAIFALFISRIAIAGDTTMPARLTLLNGSNDVQVHDLKLRVIRASVPTADAHSFESYTIFVVSGDQHARWQQVLVDNPGKEASNFRSTESADSNVQSIAMYSENRTLFVVQARKIGLKAPDLYLKETRIAFTVYRFNDDLDYPRFVHERTVDSTASFLNASDALEKEFFRR